MKDLIQCTVARNDFQRWLELGHTPLTIWQGEKATTVLTRLEKRPSLDYLYQTSLGQDNSISWNNGLTFCGAYDIKNQTLYLTEGSMVSLAAGQAPLAINTGVSVMKEICEKINRQLETTIANDPSNLPVQEITGGRALRDLQYYQEYGAKEEAIQRLFNDNAPDGQFHSSYTLDKLPETAFLAYIQDPDGFVQAETEQYIKENQESFLKQFLENDALMAEYQALMRDTSNPLHRVKAISETIKTSGAKTVTVTVQKAGEELSFRTGTTPLRGRYNSYSSSHITATDRQEFERLFGRYSDYKAEDIARITYGKKVIYEAPPMQAEDMAKSMVMGGMVW